jgi:hypothetical protein
MTPARQQRKQGNAVAKRLRGPGRSACGAAWSALWRLALAALLLVVALPGLPDVRAAITVRVVTDPHTGLALHGIDPVAYFLDGAPRYGRPDQEYRYAGAIWRFRNEGNKAAFAADPDIYMPRYGGYDPVALGRAVALPGNPLVWALVGERLYLFYNDEARERFIAGPDEAIRHADNKWPAVLGELLP